MTGDQWVPESEQLFEAARDLYENADYEKATPLFERLLAEDAGVCRRQDLELWLAACYVEQWKWAKGAELLRKLVKRYDSVEEPLSYAQAIRMAGRCEMQTGSYARAEEILEEFEHYAQPLLTAGEIWMLFEGRFDLGRVQAALGRPEEALKTFDLAESGVPATVVTPVTKSMLDYERARALHYLGDHLHAIQVLETLDPHLFHGLPKREYWLLLVRCQEWIKEHEKALTAFTTLEALGIPDSLKAEAHHWAGRACYCLGQGPESLQHFRESMKHPSDSDWVRVHNTHYLDELRKAGYY